MEEQKEKKGKKLKGFEVEIMRENVNKKENFKTGELTEEQKNQFEGLMERNMDIFENGSLGRTVVTKHKIDSGTTKPIKQSAYRIGPKEKQIIKEEVEKMLKEGVIRKSKSPWTSPVVLVKKKDGSIRFCVDYGKVNGVSKKDNHPLPRIDDTLDTLQGMEYFSKLDLARGYWQVEMEESDKEKTAFITHEGIYEFNVMPFGLSNAPATFQRLMQEVLDELVYKKVLVYIDDIIVYSKTFEQHLKDLEEVFEKLRKAELKAKLKKCEFIKREVEYLGHVVGRNGIKTSESNVEKVKNYPRPITIKELRGFLGLASYYRKFIEGFSKLAKPLLKLMEGMKYEKVKTKEGTKIGTGKRINRIMNEKNIEKEWGIEQEESFQLLKRKLTTTPILAYPDFEKKFRLYTDASGQALGAVLQQEGEDKKEHVIAYASKSLTKAEQNYSVTELESLAMVWAVEKFRHYLLGGKGFTIITDHYALKWLQSQKINKRVARWKIKLQEYEPYEIEYKEGKKHTNADAMSRMRNENLENERD